MNVAVLVASYGDQWYGDIARRAVDSAYRQVPDAAMVAHVHDPGGTLAGVRNRLAREVPADWLCFLDADDELCAGYVAAMAAAAASSSDAGPRLLAPAVLYCDGDRARGPAAIPNLGAWPESNECVIGTLVPRDLFLAVGGFRELPSLEDYDLWLRCWRAGASIAYVPDAVYVAHARPGSRNDDQSVYWRLRDEHADLFR